MVFRVIGLVMVVALVGVAGCGDDSGGGNGGGAGAGAGNSCVGGVPNGLLEGGEQCDTMVTTTSCAALNMGGGMLTCSAGCMILTSMCSMGGNTGFAGAGGNM